MKQFSKQKIQRMRNLATGDYGSKTKASSGYTSYEKKRSEGDVWEENDKTWTIKNGINKVRRCQKEHANTFSLS